MNPFRRLHSLFSRNRLDAEMREEMRQHIEEQTRRNIAAGMDAEEAQLAAERSFGNVSSLQERGRDARAGKSGVWLDQFAQDLRFAGRMLVKTPGTTATVVLTLALGIGVNAALFAIYDILALRPLPSRAPDELVGIRGRNDQVPNAESRFSYPDYLDYRAGARSFSDLVAVTDVAVRLPEEIAPLPDTEDDPRRDIVVLQKVSGNYFSGLGTDIALGRDFMPDEAGLHAGKPVIVLSHQFWQTRLDGDPDVLGRVLQLSDVRGTIRTGYTVVGVASPDFVGQSPLPPAGWAPLTATRIAALEDRSMHFLAMTGRLRAGVAVGQALSELDTIAQRLAVEFPEEHRANAVWFLPAMRILNIGLNREFMVAMSPVLLGFVLVLVISCMNVANLLLARGVTRQQEIGVRLVLGAGRGRIVRQLFAENLLLCVLGACGALLLAIWTLQAMKPVLLSMLATEPRAQDFVSGIDIGLDGRIILFGAILAAVAGLTAGLAPALHSVRRDGAFALKQDGSVFGRRLSPSRLRALLLVGQVAICLALLAVCGLMTGRLLRVRAAGTGFVTEGVFVVAPLSTAGNANALSSDPLEAVETLRTLPGVESACIVADLPLRRPGETTRSVAVLIDGDKPQRISHNRVSAGFFDAFGVPIVRGRSFTPSETMSGAQVAVVSESAAKRLWPGREPLGRILAVEDSLFVQRTEADERDRAPTYRECEVIGVSRDFRSNWGNNAGTDVMFLPPRTNGAVGTILVRLKTKSASAIREVEAAAAAAGLPVKFKDRLSVVVDRGLWPFRAFASISGSLTALALLLATVGLYGVVSFGVNQRVREIGVRVALGATAERVTSHFVSQGMKLVGWGMVIGLAGGWGFAVLLGKAMPGAGFAGAPVFRCVVFAVVTFFLAIVALLACWLPARRAAKVDPMVALRAE